MASGVLTTIVNTLVMMVGYPVYLHFLGYEEYGLWLVLSVVLTFAQLGNLGIGPAVTKLVAEEYGRGNIESVQRYMTTAVLLLCLSGSVVLSGILLFRGPIVAAFKLSPEDANVVSSLIPYVGLLSVYVFIVQVFDGALSGLGRMDHANFIQTAGRIISISATIALLYAGLGIRAMLIGSVIAYVAKHVLFLVGIRRLAHIRLLRLANLDPSYARRLVHFGSGVFGGSVISMLFNPFNKLMLTRYAGVATVPIYEIAFTGASHVRSLIGAALRPLMPEISRLSGLSSPQGTARIGHIHRRIMRLVCVLGVPLYALLFALAPSLLRVWLGQRYVDALPGAFRVMLVGTFLSLLGVPAYYSLMGMGRIRHNFGAHVIQTGVSALMVVLGLLAGTLSVGVVVWASAIAMGAATLYLTIQNRRLLCDDGQL